jgi:hypothetical protein
VTRHSRPVSRHFASPSFRLDPRDPKVALACCF